MKPDQLQDLILYRLEQATDDRCNLLRVLYGPLQAP